MTRYRAEYQLSVRCRLISLGMLLLCWSSVAHALVSINPPAYRADVIELTGYSEILVDESGSVAREDIFNGRSNSRFIRSTPRNISLGYSGATAWARFAVSYPAQPTSTSYLLELKQTSTDRIEVFEQRDGQVQKLFESGDYLPFSQRPLNYRQFVFPLTARAGETVAYYLRVEGPTSSISLPLNLWEATAFAENVSVESSGLGLYYGMMGILALAAILFAAVTREVTFAFYALYLLAFVLMLLNVNGFTFQYLWPDSPWLQQRVPTVAIALSIACAVMFIRRLLRMHERCRQANYLAHGLVVIAGLAGLIQLVDGGRIGTTLAVSTGIVLPPLLLYVAIRCVVLGDRTARFVLAGWLVYLLGVSTTGIHLLGLLPHSFFTAHGMQIGSVVEFVLLSVALADRFWSLKRTRDRELEQANAALSSLNAGLESRVGVRTRELEEKNDRLRELAVRDGLTGLYNHTAAVELLEQQTQQSRRYGYPLAVVMLDIDHFKRVNDELGHLVGDDVLSAIADVLREAVRSADVVGRYGGEEFLMLMSHIDVAAAREFAEKLLQRVRDINVPSAQDLRVSASIGIFVYANQHPVMSGRDLIERADAALYRSKRDGRDRVTIDSISLLSDIENRG